MQRLSALDTGFLALETVTTPLHLGAVLLLEGPAPPLGELRAEIARRAAAVPECRRRIRRVAGGLARPVWVPDEGFDADRHVTGAGLAPTGDDRALRSWVAGAMQRRLDVDRPPWAVHQLNGLADARWALVVTAHHSLVDGVAGAGLLGALLAPERAGPPVGDCLVDVTAANLAVSGAGWAVGLPYRAGLALARVASEPHAVGQQLHDLCSGVRAVAVPDLPPSSLSGTLGGRRLWAWSSHDLAGMRGTAQRRDCTLNDLFLAALAGGYRRHLLERDELEPGLRVRVIVPVSMRVVGEARHTGNIDAALFAELPVHETSLDARVRSIARQTSEAKTTGVPRSTHAVVRAADHLPAPLLTRAARSYVRHGQRRVNLAASDVHGPVAPMSVCGRRVVELVPVTPVALDVRASWSMLSYAGRLTIAVTADADGVPDLDDLLSAVDEAMTEITAEHAC